MNPFLIVESIAVRMTSCYRFRHFSCLYNRKTFNLSIFAPLLCQEIKISPPGSTAKAKAKVFVQGRWQQNEQVMKKIGGSSNRTQYFLVPTNQPFWALFARPSTRLNIFFTKPKNRIARRRQCDAKKCATLVSGVEGQDVVSLLQDALNRRGDVKIEICAILNDTTGWNRTRDPRFAD